jgi:hypothetical protein
MPAKGNRLAGPLRAHWRDQIVIVQRQIAASSNEIPAFTLLLSSLYLPLAR